MDIISVQNLTKDYGLGRGVFNVNLAVQKGEVYGFLGPNGAGKSTTIRHLMGFSKPDSGRAEILGKDTFKNYYRLFENVGYLPGEVALPEGLTGYQFLKMMKDLRHIKNEKMMKSLIEKFELDPSGETKSMGTGQRRKLAIVAAFMHDPDILILDEPTSGLDPIMQEVFINFILNEKEKEKTILLSSHIFTEVDATCDEIAIIKDGKIVDKFITNDLKHNKTKVFELYFENANEITGFCNECSNKPFIEVLDMDTKSKMCHIRANDDNINEVLAILSKYNIEKFIENKVSLQEYFMKFYKEDLEYKGV